MEFRELSIRIDREPGGSFSAIATDGVGESKRQPFVPPFELAELTRALPGAAATVARGGKALRTLELDVTGEWKPLTDLKQRGTALFEALLNDQIEFLYNKLISEPSKGVRLRISVGSSDPELSRIATIPWELLVSPKEGDLTLALSTRHSIVRSLALPVDIDHVEIPRPLRILMVRSNPSGSRPLELNREREQIGAAWYGALDTEVVDIAPTRDALRDGLDTRRFHVLHFMGHGTFSQSTGEGALLLEHSNGTADPVYAEELRVMVADRGLRLAFLNACETGTTALRATDDPFGGLAAALVAAGVPAVVANQFPISDQSAIEFAETFYTRLVSGAPVDAAMSAGRQRLFRVEGSEWATPVLYMRSRSGTLFSMRSARELLGTTATVEQHRTVFLAATSAALADVRAGLAEGLRANGCNVVDAEHDDQVRALVGSAALTVHLLDADPGAPRVGSTSLVPGVPDTLPLRHLVIGTQAARSQLVLYEGPMDAATIPDRRYAAYFESLIRRTRDARRFEVNCESRSRMRETILARLATLGPNQPSTDSGAQAQFTDEGINRVYVDVHSSDVDETAPLLGALRARNLSVTLGGIVASGSPAARQAAAEDEVLRSDLVILVFGTVAPEWAEQRFNWLDELLSERKLTTRIAIFTPTAKSREEMRFNWRRRFPAPVFDTATGMADRELDQILVRT